MRRSRQAAAAPIGRSGRRAGRLPGPFRPFEEAELSGAELPPVARGASLRGAAPEDGVAGATAGGRKVELVRGCTETGEFTVLPRGGARLVETEHVDAVVGGNGPSIRDVARLYPTVAFVATSRRRPELRSRTGGQPLPLRADCGQSMAGLGAYAYHELGWRRASSSPAMARPGLGRAADAFISRVLLARG